MIAMTASQRIPRRFPALWPAVHRAAQALRQAHQEQVLMWDLWWQANRASVPDTGPLTWTLTLSGYRLAGDHLPVPEGQDRDQP
jgi:hypothetical protein